MAHPRVRETCWRIESHHSRDGHYSSSPPLSESTDSSSAGSSPSPLRDDIGPSYYTLQATPEPSVTESMISDSNGVVTSEEDLEESINTAVDADVPKDSKVAEVTEATSSEPAPTSPESEPVMDSKAAAPSKEETTESTPLPTSKDDSKGTKNH